MKLMRTLKWLIVRMIMQMKCGTSLMRNHEALSLGRSYPDRPLYWLTPWAHNPCSLIDPPSIMTLFLIFMLCLLVAIALLAHFVSKDLMVESK